MSDFREYLQNQLDTDPEFREWWEMREQMQQELSLKDLYRAIETIKEKLEHDHDDSELMRPDYQKVKALAACYELTDYLAGAIAAGEPEAESDGS